MQAVKWHSEESQVFYNPRLSAAEIDEAKTLIDEFSELKNHIWIATSGSTSLKWAALSKTAVLTSASAVNAHLRCTKKDVWLTPLPIFHVGGLGVFARSHLCGFTVKDISNLKWDPVNFLKIAEDCQATLSALVPAQIYDLLSLGLKAPVSFRGIIIGGAGLSPDIYSKAINLGWPLLPSYGLTECSSQVATAEIESIGKGRFPLLKVLSHVDVSIDPDEFICLDSASLLSGYAFKANGKWEFSDPKINGVYRSEDRGSMKNGYLEVKGRNADFVKIGGEAVNMSRLEHLFQLSKLELNFKCETAIVAMPDARLGHAVHLAATQLVPNALIDHFHKKVMPYEKIRKIHVLEALPKTALGKLIKSDLIKLIVNNKY